MNKLWVRHIREALNTNFAERIQLEDYKRASDSLREKAFLTRALAALAVQRFTGLHPIDAAKTVVDESGDNGIDAIWIDEPGHRIIVVQSKWDGAGKKGIGLGDSRNFIGGFKDLLDLKYDRFGPKLRAFEDRITAALDDPEIRFTLIVATTGTSELSPPVSNAFNDVLSEMNEAQQIVSLEILGISEFHSLIVEGLDGSRIDLTVTLENWGTTGEPYEAYYGIASAASVAEWYERHGDRLFSQNIRKSLGGTPVNESLVETLQESPEHFWYFNNGVTALCHSVKKTARRASSRTFGDFFLSGVSVVNGAQTVASIHRASKILGRPIEDAQVWVRFISLEGCPANFGSEVTRATNTQNSVESRDFVALDDEQGRLRTELLLSLNKNYSIKRGESVPTPEDGCTVVDATVALACANRDPQYAVLAKSKVGSLWENRHSYYKSIFNPSVGPYRVWRCVETMRAVDAKLESLQRQQSLEGRPQAIARQGNRLILHIVFRDIDLHRVDDPEFPWESELERVPNLAEMVLFELIAQVEKNYPSSYPTSLFKNIGKCKVLASCVRERMQSSN
ncbi:AIPR family protein [Saccharopolyspora sp. 5N708]|uniref:AIPR family protein n=1 Tax=Saccharopolyspora sp. 5N708 TaxID=3457424 RepID=UPI003FD0D46F